MRSTLWFGFALSFLFTVPGCGGAAYCQSGPKQGTTCYSDNDLHPPGRPAPAGDDKLNSR